MNLLWTAIAMGLAGSLHCLAMCGPLALSLPGSRNSGVALWLGRLLYNFGRIASYVVIGLVFGLLGQLISLVAYQQHISIMAGIILLLLILWRLFPKIRSKNIILRAWCNFSSKAMGKLLQNPGWFSMLGFGVLNGFLPCGLVYLAATASLNQGSFSYSIIYMFLFGLGTLPMMLGLSMVSKVLGFRWKLLLNKAVPYMMVMVACLFILRGMALNIPFISPKITQTEQSGEIKSCCTKQAEVKACH